MYVGWRGEIMVIFNIDCQCILKNTLTILSKTYPAHVVVTEGDQQFKGSCLMMIINLKKLFTYTHSLCLEKNQYQICHNTVNFR